MKIEKKATQKNAFYGHLFYYERAREAFYDLLFNMQKNNMLDLLLLPGYIGWSPKEGSGIYDPVKKMEGLSTIFYKVNSNLEIDLPDLERKIELNCDHKIGVLIVNYFGFVDPRMKTIQETIRKFAGWVIEDNAHGFFTHLFHELSSSDAHFFSLHKMFPFENGGSLLLANRLLESLPFKGSLKIPSESNPWNYDVKAIATRRRNNFLILRDIVCKEKYSPYFVPLKDTYLPKGIIPQSFPILIKKGNRDLIYEKMNQSGYGVVSLYHTLIEPLNSPEFSDSLDLSHQILNLPTHQDVDTNQYVEMVSQILHYCEQPS